MSIEEIRNLDAAGVEARIAEIRGLLEQPDADLEALSAEVDALEERRAALRAAAEQRANLMGRVAAGQSGIGMRSLSNLGSAAPENRSYNASSPEYRRAWLKNMAVLDGRSLLGEMTQEERSAFTFTTSNTGNVVPTDTLNRIIELIRSEAPILADATMSRFARGFGVPRHTAIDQGDAKGVTEGAANTDEEDSFDLLPLDGTEIKKHVVITRKMQFQSIDAFESWLVDHIAKRIRVAKERHILARLSGSAPDGGSAVAAAAIASGNITSAYYTDTGVRTCMSKIETDGEIVIYANRKTIWTGLFGIVDGDGRQLFQPNSMGEPEIQGRIYGAAVKSDNNIADDVVYFITKGQVLANDAAELEMYSAVEPKTVNTIITGYSLFDAGLQNPKGAVKCTFSQPDADTETET